LATVRSVLVITGAGISAESGIPTFRGPGGYWRNMDPMKLATMEAFRTDPDLVWTWYRERREMARSAAPNPAHEAVARLAVAVPQFMLVTQNVDNLHQRARAIEQSIPSARIVQIHGDLFVTRCVECAAERRDDDKDEDGVPRCPQCGAAMRPGVVWFGEYLDPRNVARVEAFIQDHAPGVSIVVGTTATFGYIESWARTPLGTRGQLIEVNPEPTPLSSAATTIVREPAATALPRVVEELLAGGDSQIGGSGVLRPPAAAR
jgi:NAD-dependent deacetylase